MAKVQRVGLATTEQGGVGTHVDNEVATALGAALLAAQATKNAATPKPTPTIDSPSPSEKTQ